MGIEAAFSEFLLKLCVLIGYLKLGKKLLDYSIEYARRKQ